MDAVKIKHCLVPLSFQRTIITLFSSVNKTGILERLDQNIEIYRRHNCRPHWRPYNAYDRLEFILPCSSLHNIERHFWRSSCDSGPTCKFNNLGTVFQPQINQRQRRRINSFCRPLRGIDTVSKRSSPSE
jgi:hypothetical protein